MNNVENIWINFEEMKNNILQNKVKVWFPSLEDRRVEYAKILQNLKFDS